MKILLIQPRKPEKAIGGEDFHIYEPLALEYLASGVRDNHDVRIFDMRLENDLDTVLKSFNPDVVGITAYTVHVNVVKQLFERIKSYNPEIFTVVGGHHATVMPEDFIVPSINMVIIGEGVFTFKEVIERFDRKKEMDGIPGTAFKKDGKIIYNKNDQAIDLDSFPFPDRSLTTKYRKNYFSEWMKPLASIRTSKGCPFKCNFCALWKLTGGKYLTRSPEKIVEELGTIDEKYVFFADDESLVNAKRMKTLAHLIKQSGIKKHYFLYGRSDTIAKHPDLIEAWKEVGLQRVFIGLEFFRDDDLTKIRKGSTNKDNIEAVRILKSLDIDIHPNFMVSPDFSKNDFKEFRKSCLNLDFDFIGFSVMTPLPGTDLYDDVKNKMIIDNYDYYDFFHTFLPTKLPLKEFYKEYVSLFKKSRSVSKQISFMKKYPIAEIPSLYKLYFKFVKQLNNIHKDYIYQQ
ncbi:MAG: cobalamin B12-binding domain-containing protein [Ignavibacteriales bacterium]|nr:cobalamin B12-binding domain-containing protein [Ignavibacteriales bacterium]